MKPANSVLMPSSDTESAGTTAPQCRESFYLFRLSTLTGADHGFGSFLLSIDRSYGSVSRSGKGAKAVDRVEGLAHIAVIVGKGIVAVHCVQSSGDIAVAAGTGDRHNIRRDIQEHHRSVRGAVIVV